MYCWIVTVVRRISPLKSSIIPKSLQIQHISLFLLLEMPHAAVLVSNEFYLALITAGPMFTNK